MNERNKITIIPENVKDAKCAEQMEALIRHWVETEEGKKEMLSIINKMFYFFSDGSSVRREEE